MANKKFSEFVLKTSTSDVSHIVGYNGSENIQITPANFVTTGGTGVFLPLAGGTMTGDTTHNDNVKSIYGNPGNDLQIYHDGLNSYIQDTGTGGLIMSTNLLEVYNAAVNEFLIVGTENGAVDLYYNGSKKFETTTTGISVTGGGTFTDNVTIEKASAVNLRVTDGTQNIYVGSSGSARFGLGAGASIIQSTGAPFGIGTQDGQALRFGTNNNEVLTLDASGNSTFAGSLNVSNGAVDLNKSDGIYISLKHNNSLKGYLGIANQVITGGSTGDIGLSAANNLIFGSGGTTEKMRLNASGELGIGTTTPSQKLEVKGNIRAYEEPSSTGAYIDVVSGATWRFKANPTSGTNLYGLDIIKGSAGTDVKLSIDQNGNLGLGTSSPNSYAGQTALTINSSGVARLDLDISNAVQGYLLSESGYVGLFAGSGNNLRFGSNGTEKMRLDASGNLGVGTSTPRSALDVTGTTGLTWSSASLESSGLVTIGTRGTGGSLFINTPSINTDWSAGLGIDGSYSSNVSTVNIKAFGPKLVSGGLQGSNLTFSTTYEATLVERMRIDRFGNVGIGTSTPASMLQVGNGVSGTGLSTITMTGPNSAPQISTKPGFYHRSLVGLGVFSDSAISFEVNGFSGLSEAMRIDATGSVGFGTTIAAPTIDSLFIESADNYALYSGSDGTGTSNHMVFGNANSWVGTITTNGSATAYNTSSDYRLKEDLQDFKGLELVSKIPVYDYKWKADESRSYGVMAHELAEVLPDAVSGDKDAEEMQGVDYSKIVPLLVKSIQELSAKLEALECQCKKK